MSNQQADAIDVANRTIKLRRIFAALIHRPNMPQEACGWLIDAIDRQHGRNVVSLGWRVAEEIRAHAFADAASDTLPAGEATDSNFATFAEVFA